MKKAKDLKKNQLFLVGGEELEVDEVEISEVGKQGTRKIRIVAKKKNGEKIVIIRPEDYPVDSK